jgi:Flp pilus assembly protein TadD
VCHVLIAIYFVSQDERTHGYLDDFRDRGSFTWAAVRGAPHSALAHRNRGVYYHLERKVDDAKREYETALRLDPAQVVAHNNLGVIYMAQAQLADAERELRSELAINPSYAEAHDNLAMILRATGRQAEAIRHWQAALASNPRDRVALTALAEHFQALDPARFKFYRDRLVDAPTAP